MMPAVTERRVGLILADMRRRRGISQAHIARRLGVSQVNVSRIERSPDVQVSTLRSYVSALGGRLGFTVSFDDDTALLGLDELREQLEACPPGPADQQPTWSFDPDGRSVVSWTWRQEPVSITLLSAS